MKSTQGHIRVSVKGRFFHRIILIANMGDGDLKYSYWFLDTCCGLCLYVPPKPNAGWTFPKQLNLALVIGALSSAGTGDVNAALTQRW